MLKQVSNSSLQNLKPIINGDERNGAIMTAEDQTGIERLPVKKRLAAGVLMWFFFAAVAFVPASHFRNAPGALLIAVMLFLTPGAAWVGIMGFKRRSMLQMITLAVMASAGLIVSCLIVRFLFGLPVSRNRMVPPAGLHRRYRFSYHTVSGNVEGDVFGLRATPTCVVPLDSNSVVCMDLSLLCR